jgi:ADP-ribose pyrophosphatase
MASKLIDRQVLYNGKKVRLELHHLQSEVEDDDTRYVREVVVHPGAVVVIGFLPDDQVMLIRNYRYAIGQILLELPAGTLEKNEDPINCAGRELLEETGYLAGRMKPIGNFFTSPGILSEKIYAFAAYDLEQQGQALEEGEEITLEPTPYDEVLRMIDRGEIHDGKTIAAILMYDRTLRRRKQV